MGIATILTIMATTSRLINKVKETLKSVNKLGLAAIMLIAFATMAFTPEKKTTTLYGFDRSTEQWTDLTGITEGLAVGNYQCDTDPNNENCTAEFDHSPSPEEQPLDGRKGIFYIIE